MKYSDGGIIPEEIFKTFLGILSGKISSCRHVYMCNYIAWLVEKRQARIKNKALSPVLARFFSRLPFS